MATRLVWLWRQAVKAGSCHTGCCLIADHRCYILPNDRSPVNSSGLVACSSVQPQRTRSGDEDNLWHVKQMMFQAEAQYSLLNSLQYITTLSTANLMCSGMQQECLQKSA